MGFLKYICFHFCAFFSFLQCITRSVPTHMLTCSFFDSIPLPTPPYFPVQRTERLLGKIEKHRSHFSTLSLFEFFSRGHTHTGFGTLQTLQSADIKITQQLQSADIKRTSQIRLTLNNKIECTSSEQIKLHQEIKSISKNSACDEGIQTASSVPCDSSMQLWLSHRPTKQVLTVHKQCLVIALCNSGYHIYPPNKC